MAIDGKNIKYKLRAIGQQRRASRRVRECHRLANRVAPAVNTGTPYPRISISNIIILRVRSPTS
jgi:hypothetical protein